MFLVKKVSYADMSHFQKRATMRKQKAKQNVLEIIKKE